MTGSLPESGCAVGGLSSGWSRELVAERLGVVNKYYADIERGTCGMSVETLLTCPACME